MSRVETRVKHGPVQRQMLSSENSSETTQHGAEQNTNTAMANGFAALPHTEEQNTRSDTGLAKCI